MEKQRIGGQTGSLTIDYCPRCGGMWFERGEVGLLSRREPGVIRDLIVDPSLRVRPPCQACQAPIDRAAAQCAVCGRRNVLDCPVCDQAMERRAHDALVLDICKRCHGVWFDNAELSTIWRLNLAASTEAGRRRGGRSDAMAVGGDVLFSAMFWTPDLVVYGGMASVQAVGAAGEVVAGAAEGVFATVMEIISGLFE